MEFEDRAISQEGSFRFFLSSYLLLFLTSFFYAAIIKVRKGRDDSAELVEFID
jgi:hypothetical protein